MNLKRSGYPFALVLLFAMGTASIRRGKNMIWIAIGLSHPPEFLGTN